MLRTAEQQDGRSLTLWSTPAVDPLPPNKQSCESTEEEDTTHHCLPLVGVTVHLCKSLMKLESVQGHLLGLAQLGPAALLLFLQSSLLGVEVCAEGLVWHGVGALGMVVGIGGHLPLAVGGAFWAVYPSHS